MRPGQGGAQLGEQIQQFQWVKNEKDGGTRQGKKGQMATVKVKGKMQGRTKAGAVNQKP